MKRRSFVSLLLGGLATIPFLKSSASATVVHQTPTHIPPVNGMSMWFNADDFTAGDTVWKDRTGNGHDLHAVHNPIQFNHQLTLEAMAQAESYLTQKYSL